MDWNDSNALSNQPVELIHLYTHEDLFTPEHDEHEHDHGSDEDHDHGDLDPHIWISPTKMIDVAENKPGFIRAMWCGERECEDMLKEKAGVSSRCIPFEGEERISDTCVCCGKKAKNMLYWGKAY